DVPVMAPPGHRIGRARASDAGRSSPRISLTRLKVTLLSYEDGGGGAGRAALKLHQALLASGIESRLRVRSKTTDLQSVYITKPVLRKAIGKLAAPLTQRFMRLQRSSN